MRKKRVVGNGIKRGEDEENRKGKERSVEDMRGKGGGDRGLVYIREGRDINDRGFREGDGNARRERDRVRGEGEKHRRRRAEGGGLEGRKTGRERKSGD